MSSMVDISEVLLELGLYDSATDKERAVVSTALVKATAAVKRFLRYDPEYKVHTEYYPQADSSAAVRDFVWEANDNDAYIRRLSEAGTEELQLRHLPVRSIVNLWIDYDGRSGARSGSFSDDTKKSEGDDYWPNYNKVDSDGNPLCSDGIIRSIGMWPITPGSVKVEYVAGYTDSELHGQDDMVDASAIMEVIIDEACRRARKDFTWAKHTRAGFLPGPLTGESLGDYSWSADTSISSKMFGGSWDLMGDNTMKLQPFVNWGISQ